MQLQNVSCARDGASDCAARTFPISHFPFPIPCPYAHREQRVPHSFAAFEICQGAATNLCAEKSMNSCTRRKALLNFNLKRLKLALKDSLNLVGSLHRNVVSL